MPISSLLLIHHTHHIFHSYVTNNFHRSILPSIGSKIVQVIRVYDKLNAIVINDRKHFVTVFLTDHACKEYRRDYESLDTLINSIAKINEFHVSTLMQCSSYRDLNLMMRTHKISVPFSLQANYIEFVGNSDLTVIDNPIDINLDPDVKKAMYPLNYITMVSNLVSNQFPSEKQLPDAGK